MPRSGEHPCQFVGQAHAFDLGQIGRVFNHAVADDAGYGDADGVHGTFSVGGQRRDLLGQHLHQFAAGHGRQRVHLVLRFGIAQQLAGEPLILKPAGHDVFGHYDADGGSHCDLHGKNAWRGDAMLAAEE